MKKFNNLTNAGNEKAIRRGIRVPDGDVNLSWVKSPALNPADNMVIVDTSLTIDENNQRDRKNCRVVYANEMGVLQELSGENTYTTAIFDSEFPSITDVFTADENYSTTSGDSHSNNEYKDSTILPYYHVSRFFHVDHAGITIGDLPVPYKSEHIKVVDSNGREYVDENGNKKYKIKLVAVRNTDAGTEDAQGRIGTQNAYRVWAFVDSMSRDGLYLKYNKVELNTNGTFKAQNINHKEILNPQPYFEYIPEESDVIDPSNRYKKWYSSKSVVLKDQILGNPITDHDGYKIYVPRKAVGDPRLFQLFRWRVACDFVEDIVLDPSDSRTDVNVGIIVTDNQPKSFSPYAFYNLENSQFNVSGMKMVNPLNEGRSFTHPLDSGVDVQPPETKTLRQYWEVNIDHLQPGDIEKFDLLVFSMHANTNFDKYLTLFKYFTEDVGGTLFIDTNFSYQPKNTFWSASRAVDASTGDPRQVGVASTIKGRLIAPYSKADEIWNGEEYGGWSFNDGSGDEYRSMSCATYGPIGVPYWHDQNVLHHIIDYPDDYEIVMRSRLTGGNGEFRPVVVRKETPEQGYIYLSTMGNIYACNYLFDPQGNTRLTLNQGEMSYDAMQNYQMQFEDAENKNFITISDYVDNSVSEGAYKFLYNILLLAKRGTVIDNVDEKSFATAWSFYTPWKSDWTIDGEVLSDNERKHNDFVWEVKDPSLPEQAWQKKLDSKNVRELIDAELNNTAEGRENLRRVQNMQRTYRFEITNDQVEMPSTVDESTRPSAWTDAYSPPFEIPIDLGPNVILEETVSGDFSAADYSHVSYPPKPYQVRVGVDYVDTYEELIDDTVTVTVTGTATETITRQKPIYHETSFITWASHGYKTLDGGTSLHNEGPWPAGMTTWTEENYHRSLWGNSNMHWSSMGINHTFKYGDTHEVVTWTQHALGALIDRGVFPGPKPAVTGYYGTQTRDAVFRFQQSRNARFVDGIAGLEFYSLLSNQVIRFQSRQVPDHQRLPRPARNSWGWMRFYGWPEDNGLQQASDGGPNSGYGRVGYANGPDLQEHFTIKFPEVSKILGIYVNPHLPEFAAPEGGAIVYNPVLTRQIRLDHIHIANDGESDPDYVRTYMRNFNTSWAQVQNLNAYLTDTGAFQGSGHGTAYMWAVGPYRGDQITISLSSVGHIGLGMNTKTIGLRDFGAIAEFARGGESYLEARKITVTHEKTISVRSNQDVTYKVSPQGYTGSGTLSNFQWTDIVISPDTTNVGFALNGDTVTLQHSVTNTVAAGNHTRGTEIPPITYTDNDAFNNIRSMDENGILKPGPETGWITKTDGIKLLCDSNKKPIGFPEITTDIGPNEWQRLYSTISVIRMISDPSILVSFYDFRDKEFIVNKNGEPKMSYAEYMTRGPENIYIGIISNYQLEEKRALPAGDSAPPLPYRWAMPVYGACTPSRSRIGIEPLPDDLGHSDMWHVPIRTGKFSTSVTLPYRYHRPSTNTWQRDYSGKTVKAYYDVPEAELGGWSSIYGRPYKDIHNERPEIIGDNVIKVKQAPVLMWSEPTALPGAGDPVRPVFNVFRRDSVGDSWQEVGRNDILDYDVSNGTIYLKNPLASIDSDLVRVNYTTSRTTYSFKGYDGNRLNLNPYPGHNRDLIGKAIYIYIIPHYVKDPTTGRIVAGSYSERTLRWTTSPGVFNVYNPEYDPLAVQLGVIYITTALDIENLVMLDTRRRGGGAIESANTEELKRLLQESIGYWDIGHGAGDSYQKGGYVIIRLPRALEAQWPDESDIIDIIKRNITAGVEFRIQDLSGADW